MSNVTFEDCIFINVTEVTVSGNFGERKFPNEMEAQKFVSEYRKEQEGGFDAELTESFNNIHKSFDNIHKELLSKPTLNHHIGIGGLVVLGVVLGFTLLSMDWNF